MAKAKAQKAQETKRKSERNDERLTLEALDAISSDEEEEPCNNEEMNAEALALRQAISEGAFDHLLKNSGKSAEIIDGEETVEVSLDNNDEDIEEETTRKINSSTDDKEDDMEEESDEEETQEKKRTNDGTSGKALAAVYQELRGAKRGMPWAESFCIVPQIPLPFGAGGNDGNPLDIHDDLKRELAFYNMALDAANEAHKQCKQAAVPFTRPEDFFAEMVKTDDHMAKVKDRLIFETKKMDAVAQRKSNKEQKLRGKEKQANKIAEKAKRKKDHFKAVDDWAKSAVQNRGSAVREDDGAYLGNMDNKRRWTDRDGNLQDGPNRKREASDKKYGFGGKRGRFKQNDSKSLNDMSKFNPKGNFGGTGSKSKGGAGAKRQGKRARDASRSKK